MFCYILQCHLALAHHGCPKPCPLPPHQAKHFHIIHQIIPKTLLYTKIKKNSLEINNDEFITNLDLTRIHSLTHNNKKELNQKAAYLNVTWVYSIE